MPAMADAPPSPREGPSKRARSERGSGGFGAPRSDDAAKTSEKRARVATPSKPKADEIASHYFVIKTQEGVEYLLREAQKQHIAVSGELSAGGRFVFEDKAAAMTADGQVRVTSENQSIMSVLKYMLDGCQRNKEAQMVTLSWRAVGGAACAR